MKGVPNQRPSNSLERNAVETGFTLFRYSRWSGDKVCQLVGGSLCTILPIKRNTIPGGEPANLIHHSTRETANTVVGSKIGLESLAVLDSKIGLEFLNNTNLDVKTRTRHDSQGQLSMYEFSCFGFEFT